MKVERGVWVCVCWWRGCVEETVGVAADKQVKYKQKQYSSIKKQRRDAVKPHRTSLCACACLLTTEPQILVTPPPSPHITKTQVFIQLTYLYRKNTRITGGG